ncbi:MAG: hypothetical protein DMG70_33670 [Acidobacteria bacterium]|nr:MAG: hypothetical protein DMG70_33670 [Acidobacteriota bacterium]
MTGLFQDLRFAIHSLNRDRRFTLLAVLALALGIGSVTVIPTLITTAWSASQWTSLGSRVWAVKP